MVNFYPWVYRPRGGQAVGGHSRALRAKYPDRADLRKAMAEYRQAHPVPTGDGPDDVADHIDHIVKVAGIDHVGIGSDYGRDRVGPRRPRRRLDLPPAHRRAAQAAGYNETDIHKILGGNALRALRKAGEVAATVTEDHQARGRPGQVRERD